MADCPESVFFFVWWDGGYKCVILSKEEPKCQLERGGPDEEGYYYESETFTLTQDSNGNWIVDVDRYTDGRDCDGRLETSDNYWCHVGELGNKRSRCGCFPVPNWQDGGGSQRDHYAEAMNYQIKNVNFLFVGG